ncbi:MAG: OmpA family protein [Candidatus Kapabacteria bacterium]|jgi:hypothetical protein|nr:OmpA family protein [Candidatus Kapabacteria bacterium]
MLFFASNQALSQPHHHSHKTRLPEEFSAHQPTILPVLTSDGKRLYFDRKNFAENTGGTRDFDDIWVAELQPNGTWSKPRNLGAPLNTEGSDVLCSLSPDDRIALVYGVYDKELPVKEEGFSLTRFKAGVWTFPQPIRIEKFYNRTKKYYAQLAPDNRTLLLALQRDESLGGLDLYVSFRKDTSLTWSEPLHLGKTLNTSSYEGSPHLAADGKTLYFSSEGHGGSGVADLFVARRLDDSWQRWSSPQNLGSLINTSEEDSSIDVVLDGQTAYFLSSDSVGKKGLYKATLPDSVRHSGAVFLFGNVTLAKASSKKKSPQSSIQTSIAGISSEQVQISAYSTERDNTGAPRPALQSFAETSLDEPRYAMTLPANGVYLVKAELPNVTSLPAWLRVVDTRRAFLQGQSRLERREMDIVFGLEGSSSLVFPPIHCVQEQPTLRPEAAGLPALIAFAYKTLAANTSTDDASKRIMIEVVGHTCDLGTTEENEALAQERAEAVASLLESQGVPHGAITVRSEGERKPLVRSQLEEARSQNRRVEVRIVR